MARTENTELAVLCLVYNEDEYLLQHRDRDDYKGYVLPGGHIETNESIVDAVIREIKEETSLDIKNPKLCGIKQFPIENGRYIVFLFKTDEYSGECHGSDEGEIRWFKKDNLPEKELVKDFHELLRIFLEEDLTEFIYKQTAGGWETIIK
ncbi:MAG: 8-oxo-dGTP diphosphatase [Ruminococcaceae bacterium]|nr:8-oxo-dGTP diphosphatase [Oscillospiraceae bacterium]